MSEILQMVIPSLITFLTTGGIGGIFYYKLQKRAKEAEVKAAEVDVKTKEAEAKTAEVETKTREIANLSASNEEWIKLYNNTMEEKRRLENMLSDLNEKYDTVNKSKDEAWSRYSDTRVECSKKDLVISELNWYRCEVNGCPYRKPPRKYGENDFPKDGINPVENPDPNTL